MALHDAITLRFTFIRHGESVDNLRSVWAGWRDSELSNHGKAQAEALGRSLKDTHLTAIISSPLKRALGTAEILRNAQKNAPPLSVSSLLREQNFGLGEGKPYNVPKEPGVSFQAHIAKGIYPPTRVRSNRYPEGESLDDVAKRADQVIKEIILPFIKSALESNTQDLHVAFVSHGIFLGELVAALQRQSEGKAEGHHRGLRNTGWTLVAVNVMKGQKGESMSVVPFHMRVVQHNSCNHLDGLVRQKAGIGSSRYDPKQADIRSFFRLGDVSASLAQS